MSEVLYHQGWLRVSGVEAIEIARSLAGARVSRSGCVEIPALAYRRLVVALSRAGIEETLTLSIDKREAQPRIHELFEDLGL